MSGIRVICRVRPENTLESESGGKCCVEYSEFGIQLSTFERSEEPTVHAFTFDRICGPETAQSEVFEQGARPVVEGVLDGYNGTIFAYGQTGSGKTFTMEGPDIHDPELKGIIPRMQDALFEGLIQASDSIEFTLKCSFLEIYMERIQDLLDSKKNNLHLKEDKTRGIYVQDASEIYVSSPAEMREVMVAGSKNRSIATTRMNARSSRSHSIFCVHVEQRDTESGSRRSGRLYFVDLAGSEKISKTNVTGKQLEEAKMINKSLSALGNVINALGERGTGFIPYRDSKLTRMLQESLGGNSQTTLVIACSMNSYNNMETLSTLRFGQRAKKIQNKPVINQEVSSKELLKQLEQAHKETAKQTEIILSIEAHINTNYCENAQLMSEISGIIENSFIVTVKSTGAMSLKRHESEHSLVLLKQHIELVNLHEELQRVNLEKKELEDEHSYRNKELAEYEQQLQDLAGAQKLHNSVVEDLQLNLEKALFDSQQKFLGHNKLRKACERLRSDILLVQNEIPKTEGEGWVSILGQSLQEALFVISAISKEGSEDSPLRHRARTRTVTAFKGLVLDQVSEAGTERGTNTDDSFLDLEQDSDVQSLLCQQRVKVALLHQQNSELSAELVDAHRALTVKKEEFMNLSEDLADMAVQAAESQEACKGLERQLEQKVRNIEEERSTVSFELKYKDETISELKMLLEQERSQLEKLLCSDSPKRRHSDLEERLSELCTERQKLYEELVSLRKALDLRDDQLHNALQRNHKLERQLSVKNNLTALGTKRMMSPRTRPNLQEPTFFNKKIMKPIRGGGGDIWNFHQKNQGLYKAVQPVPNSVMRSQQKIERLANQNKTGIGTMVKDFIGGLLS